MATTISLIASDGTVVATAPVDLAQFRMHALMSWTSASRTRLYYLNGGSEVRFLAPDGTTGTVTRIALGAGEQAGFAVSPDDARIAVAIFSYTPLPTATYTGMRLYVEDLQGGGHHVDIFSSTTVAEFPVGWTSGRLVLAVSEPRCCQAQPGNPYDASSYHVVDPATGTRMVSICDGSLGPEGPVEPIGATCHNPPFHNPAYQRWDGSSFDVPAAVPDPTAQFPNALSPDGSRVAGSPCCDPAQGRLATFGPSGYWDWLNQSGYVLGWLDGKHIVIQQINAPALSVVEIAEWSIVAAERSAVSVSELSPGGSYLGTFPPAIS
jgi:hypothetical protein